MKQRTTIIQRMALLALLALMGLGVCVVDAAAAERYVDVRSAGARGDGRDDSAAFARAFAEAASRGVPVRIPAGEYHLESWEPFVADRPLVIVGDGAELTTLHGDGSDFAHIAASFRARDLKLVGFGTAFRYAAEEPVRGITIERIGARQGGQLLNGPRHGPVATDVRVIECDVDTDYESLGIMWRTPVEGMQVRDSRFSHIYRRAIKIGDSNAGRPATAHRDLVITGNVIDSVDGKQAASTYGIHAIGHAVRIERNSIRNLRQEDTRRGDGIYVGSYSAVVAGNHLRNIANRSSIMIKGAPERRDYPDKTGNVLVVNNVVTTTEPVRRGLNVSTWDVVMRGNRVSGPFNSGIMVSGLAAHGTVLEDNVVTGAARGISSAGAGNDMIFRRNTIRGSTSIGINIDPTSTDREMIGALAITDNHISETDGPGIYVRVRAGGRRATLEGTRITGNTIRDASRGIHFSRDSGAETPGLAVHDNHFVSIRGQEVRD